MIDIDALALAARVLDALPSDGTVLDTRRLHHEPAPTCASPDGITSTRRGVPMTDSRISYRRSPAVADADLRDLFAAAWPPGTRWPSPRVLAHGAGYVCADAGGSLVGFVNVAWDGGTHGFVLDTTVHPGHRRRGVGRGLVAEAIALARDRGLTWLHVDHEPHLDGFYRSCGFRPTAAGVLALAAAR